MVGWTGKEAGEIHRKSRKQSLETCSQRVRYSRTLGMYWKLVNL